MGKSRRPAQATNLYDCLVLQRRLLFRGLDASTIMAATTSRVGSDLEIGALITIRSGSQS